MAPINKILYTEGDKIGNCIFISEAYTKDWNRYANFKCQCGKEFVSLISKVKRLHTRSCGCLVGKTLANMNTTHGKSKTTEFNVWVGMNQRCHNPNNERYDQWGGRGITVCERWRNSFSNFYKDMGIRPKGLTLDRRDNNKGYSKDNCKWSTQKEQSNNRRSNVNITYNGETRTLKQWTEYLGLSYDKIVQRVRTLKWPPERALELIK